MIASRRNHLHLVAGCLIFFRAAVAGALTLFRLGGNGEPPPDLEVGHEFVQLPWTGVDEERFGKAAGLELRPESIRPERTDPDSNLAPLPEGERFAVLDHFPGGGILGWVPWGSVSRTRDIRFSVRMVDRDKDLYYTDTRNWNFLFDLGHPVHLTRVRFFTREDDGSLVTCGFGRWQTGECRSGGLDPVPRFILAANDGDPTKQGKRTHNPPYNSRTPHEYRFDFDIVHEGPGADVVDLEFPSIPTRRLLFQVFAKDRLSWEVAEFEIFGKGFVPAATYRSNVIDLGESLSIGELTWAGRAEEPARNLLRMRTGGDDQPDVYWRRTFRGEEEVPYGEDGGPLTRQQHERLEPAEVGSITHDLENWNAWNAPYDFAAGRGLPNADRPRRFAQFDIAFSATPEAGGEIDYLQFAASPLLAAEARGEIVPAAVPAGEVSRFTLKVKPRLEPGDPGFDGLVVATDARVTAVDPTGRLGGNEVDLHLVRLDDERFALQFPSVDIERTEELVEVGFEAEIFAYDTLFRVGMTSSEQPFEVPQPVIAGNADDLSDSDRLRVALVRIPRRPIHTLRLSPPAFTPNGDGANDLLQIEYELVNLAGNFPVQIAVYDLSGRRVREVGGGRATSGLHRTSWDGRDLQGTPLPPGLYLLELAVTSDSGRERAQRLVSLVY